MFNPSELEDPYQNTAFDLEEDDEKDFRFRPHHSFHFHLNPIVSKRLFIIAGIVISKCALSYFSLAAYEEGIEISL